MGIMLSSFKNKITELTSGTEQIVLGATILKVGEPPVLSIWLNQPELIPKPVVCYIG